MILGFACEEIEFGRKARMKKNSTSRFHFTLKVFFLFPKITFLK